jgi:hypothetical protein
MNIINLPAVMSILGWLDVALLAGLAYVTCWAVLERLQFFAGRRAARQVDLAWVAINWERTGKLSGVANRYLGWLQSPLVQCGKRVEDLLAYCHEERNQILRWQTYLPLAANMAVSLGLLGSVLALGRTAQSRDAAGIIGQGMHATIAGVAVAIVACLLYLVIRKRAQLLADQVNRVIGALEIALAHQQRASAENGRSIPLALLAD